MQNSSSKFTQILLIVILLALLFIIAKPRLFKNDISVEQELVLQEEKQEIQNSEKLTEDNKTAITSQPTNNIISNKLFDFIDTFTMDKDMSTPRTEYMYPEEHLILLSYPTSQESRAFAVYDYKNDILYKNIGYSGMGGSSIPMAFVGEDKLLMFNLGEEQIKGTLTIQDFNNKIIKTLMTNTSINEVYPKYGKVIVIDTNQQDSGRFNLNSETLELSQWKLPY